MIVLAIMSTSSRQRSAYHPGLIDFKSDKASLGVGALAALAGLFWQRTSLLEHAVWVARFQASLRVLDYFEAALTEPQQHAANQAPPQAQTPTLEQVNLAFQLLGLAPFATQSEVKARFRALAKEWHPDLFTNDASKSAEASLRMSQINVAHSVICEARGVVATRSGRLPALGHESTGASSG